MSQYPKWLLLLSASNVLLPVITMVFFLFGAVHPFGVSSNAFVSFLSYLAVQLFWLLPIGAFFAGLHLWGNFKERIGVGIEILGVLLNIAAIFLLLSANSSFIHK